MFDEVDAFEIKVFTAVYLTCRITFSIAFALIAFPAVIQFIYLVIKKKKSEDTTWSPVILSFQVFVIAAGNSILLLTF